MRMLPADNPWPFTLPHVTFVVCFALVSRLHSSQVLSSNSPNFKLLDTLLSARIPMFR